MVADVVAVKRDLRRRQVGERAFQERLGHVLADLRNVRDLAAAGLQKQRERLHRLVILALDDEHATALIQVGEHRHVLVPPPRTGLIDTDPLNASNSSVNPDRSLAHGTSTKCVLCSAQTTRGTRAVRYA